MFLASPVVDRQLQATGLVETYDLYLRNDSKYVTQLGGMLILRVMDTVHIWHSMGTSFPSPLFDFSEPKSQMKLDSREKRDERPLSLTELPTNVLLCFLPKTGLE